MVEYALLTGSNRTGSSLAISSTGDKTPAFIEWFATVLAGSVSALAA
jgi:hypothetical protein